MAALVYGYDPVSTGEFLELRREESVVGSGRVEKDDRRPAGAGHLRVQLKTVPVQSPRSHVSPLSGGVVE